MGNENKLTECIFSDPLSTHIIAQWFTVTARAQDEGMK
jgi:hypothetical protein